MMNYIVHSLKQTKTPKNSIFSLSKCLCVCVCVCVCVLRRVQLFATPWTVVHQASLSMEFFRHKCWSGLQSLLQGVVPIQGSNPCLLHWHANSLPLSHLGNHKPVLIKFKRNDPKRFLIITLCGP